jgi:hypothetical protein
LDCFLGDEAGETLLNFFKGLSSECGGGFQGFGGRVGTLSDCLIQLLKDAHVGSLESLMESPVGSSGSFCAVTGSLLVEGLGVLEELDALEAGSWNGSLKGLSPDP